MHICFASLDYPDETGGGGVGIYVKIIGHELIQKGHRVSVIVPKKAKSSPDITDDQGVKIYWVNVGNIHWYFSKIPIIGNILALLIRELEYSKAVYKTVQKIDRYNHIDIVEGTETGAYYLPRLRHKMKTVIRLHGETYTFLKYTTPAYIPIDVRLSRYLQRKSLLYSHQLTSPSDAHADEIRLELRALDLSIKVVPNPFPIPEKISLEQRVPKDSNHPLFLFVGRLERRKGLIPLLKAIPGISKKIPNAKFVFAGNKHSSIPWDEVESLIDTLDIRKSVVFLGHVGSVEMKALYMKASAVVIPSYYETFGYVYLEAIFHGVPVVAFDTVSAKNIIIDGKNGFLVPVDNIEALADACLRSIEMEVKVPDKDEYSTYDAEQVCEEMIKVYKEMLSDSAVYASDRLCSSLMMDAEKVLNVFLSPHFDDAVFSCGGLIHKQIRQGQDTFIITIFGGMPDYSHISPFAREIHNKWGSADPVNLRRSEDINAIEMLGARLIHFDFLDCIYRKTMDRRPLYNNYEGIKGAIHPDDSRLPDYIYDRLIKFLQKNKCEQIRIFAPLGLGNHVDHQIIKAVGMKLLSEGFDVLFYEELPYCFWDTNALNNFMAKNSDGWSYKLLPIDIEEKLKALKCYNSQFAGLGGSYRRAGKRFKKYAASVGNGKYAERVWVINKN
jgi:glycosyltransferase involved in cell wall biosynthesis/LmbE family N-acetylglucosaminyl deacetylase